MTQQRGVSEPVLNILVVLVIQKRPATERRTRHLESVQKTTESDTIWEFLRFECGAIAACTDVRAQAVKETDYRGEPQSTQTI